MPNTRAKHADMVYEIIGGNLCYVDAGGRMHIRASRRGDRELAHRLGATLREMQKTGVAQLPLKVGPEEPEV